MSSDLNKDKKEKTCQDKHADKDKDLLEFKKEERKPEKVREKTWYTIADIFTDESEDEDDSYNGGVANLATLLDCQIRTGKIPHLKEMKLIISKQINNKKYSEGKTHSTEKTKDKEHKDKKKEKGSI